MHEVIIPRWLLVVKKEWEKKGVGRTRLRGLGFENSVLGGNAKVTN